jgi:hypothetical protein
VPFVFSGTSTPEDNGNNGLGLDFSTEIGSGIAVSSGGYPDFVDGMIPVTFDLSSILTQSSAKLFYPPSLYPPPPEPPPLSSTDPAAWDKYYEECREYVENLLYNKDLS